MHLWKRLGQVGGVAILAGLVGLSAGAPRLSSGASTQPIQPQPVPVPPQPAPRGEQGIKIGTGEDAVVQEVVLSDGSICAALVGRNFGQLVCKWEAGQGALLPPTGK